MAEQRISTGAPKNFSNYPHSSRQTARDFIFVAGGVFVELHTTREGAAQEIPRKIKEKKKTIIA